MLHRVLLLCLLLLGAPLAAQAEIPFEPVRGETKTISATSSSSGVTLTLNLPSLLVQNAGTSAAFYRTCVSSSGCTATTSDTPILSGAILVLHRPSTHYYVAAVTASGTATVYVTPGNGE